MALSYKLHHSGTKQGAKLVSNLVSWKVFWIKSPSKPSNNLGRLRMKEITLRYVLCFERYQVYNIPVYQVSDIQVNKVSNIQVSQVSNIQANQVYNIQLSQLALSYSSIPILSRPLVDLYQFHCDKSGHLVPMSLSAVRVLLREHTTVLRNISCRLCLLS
uniref:Uncharacterized protein n=1 Tax=Timema bartmani TaxID=61472 RepID=A0A7R9F6G3_9NEOP|nr:unnamed protein product [Timema bartmani]